MSNLEPIYVDGVASEPDYICDECETLIEFAPVAMAWRTDETLDEYMARVRRLRPDPAEVRCPECGGELIHRSEYDR